MRLDPRQIPVHDRSGSVVAAMGYFTVVAIGLFFAIILPLALAAFWIVRIFSSP